MLDLNELASGDIPAITPILGAMLAEVASVCLESQGHVAGNVVISVSGIIDKTYRLMWAATTPQALRAYGDDKEATKHGAEGIAVLIADRELEYTVIEASRQGTGIDYWLGDADDVTFQHKGRLEVSGIRRGNERDVNARVNEKLNQTAPSDELGLTAYVIVVEFSQPTAKFVEKQHEHN